MVYAAAVVRIPTIPEKNAHDKLYFVQIYLYMHMNLFAFTKISFFLDGFDWE